MNQISLTKKLQELGVNKEITPAPGGAYVSVNIRGTIAYVAIQFPIQEGQYLYTGKLGKELTTEQGYEASRLAAINVLAQVHRYVGLEKVVGLNHFDLYFQASGDWDESPIVANGASELFVEVLEEKGRHSRAIFGVERLPRNFSVGICCSFTLLDQ